MSEYGGKYAEKKKEPLRIFRPVIGLIVLALGLAGAYYASEPVAQWLIVQDFLQGATIDLETMRILSGTVIVVIVISLISAVFAFMQPKQTRLVDEKQLAKEKAKDQAEQRAARRRRRVMKARMKAANKDLSDI